MRKFSFKFSTPLRIKQLTEKIERQQLSKAIAEKIREEQQLSNLLQIKKDKYSEMEEKISASVDIQELSYYYQYVCALNNHISSQENNVNIARKRCEETKISFLERRKERRVFEKLKSKQLINYFSMVNKEEQKISDELAINNHAIWRRV